MTDARLCIICNTRKPESRFETKGEHVVPRSLGSRKLLTPHVCKECNGGLGGTVDVALKNVFGVYVACFDRSVVGTRGQYGKDEVRRRLNTINDDEHPLDNPDVKGAVLKIAYESAHLRLGNKWLDDPIAVSIRDVLFACVSKDKKRARKGTDAITVHDIPIDIFYFSMGKSRSELIKRAIASKSCLNALWLYPFKAESGGKSLAVVFDIEGLPAGYVVVSESNWGIDAPVLLAPNIKVSADD